VPSPGSIRSFREWASEFWPWGAIAIALAIVSMGAVAGHRYWLQDEIPIIQQHDLIHHASGLWLPFASAYWPPPFGADLYRPLSLAFYCLQWLAGDGAVLPFHLINLALYLLCVSVVWRFARQILPVPGAFVAAALFAVHPVHVEAVALSVNQSEVLVGLLLVSATAAYVDWRRSGEADPRRPWVILAIYLVACLVKESAIVLPAIFLAAELTIIADPTPFRRRVDRLRPWGLGMALIAVAFVGVRTLVLRSFVGSFTAEGLYGLDWWGRVNTMIGIVPRWATLMLWPAHLQEDYSPAEIVGTSHWGLDQTVGVLILLVTLVLLVRSWRRQPVAAFGILWFFIGIFPVSNIVVPTGIVLAERTLFLPSLGVTLALGALVAPLGARIAAAGQDGARRARYGGAALLVLLLAAGTARSVDRMAVWRDMRTLWGQSMLDAPLSYRVNEAFAYVLLHIGEPDRFEHYLRAAIQYHGHATRLNTELADWLRLHDRCPEAVPLYTEALKLLPENERARSSELACLFVLGRYREAWHVATLGRAYLPESKVLRRFQLLSDSMALAHPSGPGFRITIDSAAAGLVVVGPPVAAGQPAR
jgi:hypothetical protein